MNCGGGERRRACDGGGGDKGGDLRKRERLRECGDLERPYRVDDDDGGAPEVGGPPG